MSVWVWGWLFVCGGLLLCLVVVDVCLIKLICEDIRHTIRGVVGMKQKRVILHFISTLLLATLILTTASAQERTVGVTEGNWFIYEVEVSWNSNDPDAVYPPQEYEDWATAEVTEWTKMTVTDVSGTNVSVEYLTHFENGEEEFEGGYIDVDTGDDANASLTILSANLGANDSLYSSGDFSVWTINETITKTYPDGVRNTNHLNMTYKIMWTLDETEHCIFQATNIYWDKETGAIVENSFEFQNQTGELLTTWSVGSRLSDSSIWTIPEFPSYSSMVIMAMIVTVSAIIIEQRLTKKQPANHN